MAAAMKMDELLVTWLSSDEVYERVLEWIENYRAQAEAANHNNTSRQETATNNNAAAAAANSSGSEMTDAPAGAGADETNTTAGNTTTTTNSSSVVVVGPIAPAPGTDDAHPIVVDDDGDVAVVAVAAPNKNAGSSGVTIIPPFYPRIHHNNNSNNTAGRRRRRRMTPRQQHETWEPLSPEEAAQAQQQQSQQTSSSSLPLSATSSEAAGAFLGSSSNNNTVASGAASSSGATSNSGGPTSSGVISVEECARDQARAVFLELGVDPPLTSPSSVHSDAAAGSNNNTTTAANAAANASDEMLLNRKYLTADSFVRVTKEVCRFPSFFNLPLYQRILDLWNTAQAAVNQTSPMEVVTYDMLEWYWKEEMEPYDASDRFYRLVKQPDVDYIVRDDFLPFIKALLNDHPGLEFLTSHAEFQEKYAVTVITRIFYCVNRCHSGRITSRQIRRSDLLEAFQQVDEEEDINNVTRYFSYEHFYVLYCRFWELDHDRDYRITREDLLKYGDHSLSHMIVDRIFDAAPRPFNPQQPNRDFLSYEDFIYFMLSEEDKSNEVSVRYWFTCVDVDGDSKLNNMEMRSFYAVQLHRMQMMGHEIVPFEDMLCQMMDMIKPAHPDYLVPEDFLQTECAAVSGALFDALVNLNKYLLFEQRDPFAERQKREDEFECDWDRFACIDYKRLAMEEEAREEEAMEIDWVTDDEDDPDGHHHHLQLQQQQQQQQQQHAAAAAAAHHAHLQGVEGFAAGQPDPSGAGISEAPF